MSLELDSAKPGAIRHLRSELVDKGADFPIIDRIIERANLGMALTIANEAEVINNPSIVDTLVEQESFIDIATTRALVPVVQGFLDTDFRGVTDPFIRSQLVLLLAFGEEPELPTEEDLASSRERDGILEDLLTIFRGRIARFEGNP
jgi:hypothetical protein